MRGVVQRAWVRATREYQSGSWLKGAPSGSLPGGGHATPLQRASNGEAEDSTPSAAVDAAAREQPRDALQPHRLATGATGLHPHQPASNRRPQTSYSALAHAKTLGQARLRAHESRRE